MASVAQADATEERPKDAVASIAGQITRLSTGDRAALRRIYLTRSPAADGVVVGLLTHAGVTVSEREEVFAPWRLLAHVAALLSGTAVDQPHAPGRRVGSALHEAGLSENRLSRLTAARGPALHDQIVVAARRLAQGGQAPVDLWTLHHLAGRDAKQAEQARIQIAKDYYAAAARSKGDSK